MIYGLTQDERDERYAAKKEYQRRPRRRFALFPVQLNEGYGDKGRWLWLEWYELRRYGWGGNTRRRWPEGLRSNASVTTHAGMTRTQMMNILLVLGLVIGLAVLYLYFQSEDRAAIAAMDYSRCHLPGCAAEITKRLTGN
jgi:hypothetical protein